MEAMEGEEELLTCVVCGEGYEFDPEGVLGEYSYVARQSVPQIGSAEGAPLFNYLPSSVSPDADLCLGLVGAGAVKRLKGGSGGEDAEFDVRSDKEVSGTESRSEGLSRRQCFTPPPFLTTPSIQPPI